MKNIRINTLHRYVGIVIAPFIVLQTISGLLLGFGLFRRGMTGHGGEGFQASNSVLNKILVKIHFGPGLLTGIYHLVLGAGIVWMAVSGSILYLRLRRARNKYLSL
jgi:uncharacterized iron-regulated membrane protein